MDEQITIDQLIEKYLSVVVKARSANTHRTYKNALGAFKLALAAHNTDFAVANVSRLKESVLGTFLDYLKDYSPATERLYIQAAVGLYKFANAEEMANFNISKMDQIITMRLRGVGRRLPQFPTDSIERVIEHYLSNCQIVLESIQDENARIRYLRDRAFIITLADTGLRVHEACNLRRGDINWHEGEAVIIGKGDKEAMIRFTKRSMLALKDYLAARRTQDGKTNRPLASLPLFARHDNGAGGNINAMTTTTGREIIHDRVIQVLGAQESITPHSFRHYFVTKILRGSGNLKLAQELARHSNIQTTERYAHLSNDELNKGYYEIFEK